MRQDRTTDPYGGASRVQLFATASGDATRAEIQHDPELETFHLVVYRPGESSSACDYAVETLQEAMAVAREEFDLDPERWEFSGGKLPDDEEV